MHEGYTEKFRHKEDEIYSWKRKWEEVKKHLDENISREHDLSRKLALAEHNLYQQT